MRAATYLSAQALRGLWRARLRSSLTLLVAALGVGGVVVASAFADSGRRDVLEQIRRLGPNTLLVNAQASRSLGGRTRAGGLVTTLVDPDYQLIRSELAGLVRTSALVRRPLRVKGGGFSKVATIVGCEPDYFRIHSWPPAAGTLFTAGDLRAARRVALLGSTVARDLYGSDARAAVGQRLFIARVPFEVVGLLTERGPGLDLTDVDNQVYVPLTAAMRRLLRADAYDALLLETDGRQPMTAAHAAVAALMRRRHRSSAKNPEDFLVQNQESLAETQLAATRRLGFLVRAVGAAGLLVADLGILATAWMGVRARTTEIGCRRALGASGATIFRQLLGEATALSLAGGAAGALVALASVAVAQHYGSGMTLRGSDFLAAPALAVGLNLLFSFVPARQAASVPPMRALRSE